MKFVYQVHLTDNASLLSRILQDAFFYAKHPHCASYCWIVSEKGEGEVYSRQHLHYSSRLLPLGLGGLCNCALQCAHDLPLMPH